MYFEAVHIRIIHGSIKSALISQLRQNYSYPIYIRQYSEWDINWRNKKLALVNWMWILRFKIHYIQSAYTNSLSKQHFSILKSSKQHFSNLKSPFLSTSNPCYPPLAEWIGSTPVKDVDLDRKLKELTNKVFARTKYVSFIYENSSFGRLILNSQDPTLRVTVKDKWWAAQSAYRSNLSIHVHTRDPIYTFCHLLNSWFRHRCPFVDVQNFSLNQVVD